jgi:hypothetical protein
MRSCTAHADQGKYRRAKWLAYCRLFGRQQNRDGHYALDFFSVDAGGVGSAIWRGPVRNAIKSASAGVSRLTAATRFEFLGFTSIFRMLSLSPRKKRAAALG